MRGRAHGHTGSHNHMPRATQHRHMPRCCQTHGTMGVARTHRPSARSTWHMHELTLSDTQKHTHEHGSTPTHHQTQRRTCTQPHTLRHTAIHTHLAVPGNIFGHHTWRGVCYWHLVRGSQGPRPTPSRAQAAPTTNSDPAPDVSSAEVEKLSPHLVRHTQ